MTKLKAVNGSAPASNVLTLDRLKAFANALTPFEVDLGGEKYQLYAKPVSAGLVMAYVAEKGSGNANAYMFHMIVESVRREDGSPFFDNVDEASALPVDLFRVFSEAVSEASGLNKKDQDEAPKG